MSPGDDDGTGWPSTSQVHAVSCAWGPDDAAAAEADTAPTPDDPDGEAVRYEERTFLAVGGMGRVDVVRDLRLGRDVARKTALHGAEDRLQREARVAARLDHPNIVPVFDASTNTDGEAFYTMRLIRGRSLAQALSGAGDLEARLRFLRPVLAACEAIAYAHEAGVIHRDLKPANLMVGEFGETQVVDWGLARLVDETDEAPDPDTARSPEDTALGTVVGTPLYMSPEQARGAPATRLSDVWGLGATLYAVVADRPPRDAPDGTTDEASRRALRESVVVPLAQRCPDAPAELVAIVDRAMQPDPARRYPTAKALAEDLAAFLDGRRVRAHAYSPAELVGRWVYRFRVPLTVAGLAFTVLVVGLALAGRQTATERDRALAARARADQALAGSLARSAQEALSLDAIPEAEVLAAHALALADSPQARGLLAGTRVAQGPRLAAEVTAPPGLTCDTVRQAEDGTLACLSVEGLSVHPPDLGSVTWSRPGGFHDALDGHAIRRFAPLADGSVVAVGWQTKAWRFGGSTQPRITATPIDSLPWEASPSPRGTRAALVSKEGEIGDWALEDDAPRWRFTVPGAVAVAGKTFALGVEDRLERHGSDGRMLCRVRLGHRTTDVAFSPHAPWLLVGDRSGRAQLLHREDCRTLMVLEGHRRRVAEVVFDPTDPALTYTVGWDESWHRWDLAALTLDPAVAVSEAEARWGLTREDVAGRRLR